MVTGFAFLSRLTQIAPPCTRFVFPGAGIRLGLPSHPASRRRSCLRLGVSTTSSSRGLPPQSIAHAGRTQGRAERAARAGHRACKSAAHREHCPERGASAARRSPGTLRTLARSRPPGLPLLGPAGPRRRPARVGPGVTAETGAAPQVQSWCGIARGPSFRCPDPEALQIRRQARLLPQDIRLR
jgi:hypothetical protein